MSSANAGWFLSPLRILLPLLALPFLLTPEADLTTPTAIIPSTKEPFMQTGRPTIGTTGLPTVTVTSEEPTTGLGVQEILLQTQGPESASTTPGQATLQRSENHTEALTPAATSLDTTSHVPEAEAPPTASYHTEALVRSTSARLESTEAAAVVSEATAAYATPILATTDTSPGRAAATTSGSQTLRSSEAFATSRSSAAAPDTPTPTPTPTRPPSATVGWRRFFSVLTTPSPTSPPVEPASSGVWSTRPPLIPVTLTPTPGVPGAQKFPVLWTALVVLLAVAVLVGALCLGVCVRRRMKRSRVLHFGSRGSRKNKGKEGDAWAGPVAMSSTAATATARDEAGDEEEEKRKGGGEEEVLLSTFGVDGTGRSSPNGRRGAGRAEEPPMLFIDEDEVEVEAKAGANNLEGGGGGEEKEKEKDGKGLNGNEQTNGGTSFCYITAV